MWSVSRRTLQRHPSCQRFFQDLHPKSDTSCSGEVKFFAEVFKYERSAFFGQQKRPPCAKFRLGCTLLNHSPVILCTSTQLWSRTTPCTRGRPSSIQNVGTGMAEPGISGEAKRRYKHTNAAGLRCLFQISWCAAKRPEIIFLVARALRIKMW